ncbi:hypothetical protein SNEBB_011244 [Seison nebaliae]|nr:hypothetical protein SNEBB_011244 [Seison nebaliae]
MTILVELSKTYNIIGSRNKLINSFVNQSLSRYQHLNHGKDLRHHIFQRHDSNVLRIHSDFNIQFRKEFQIEIRAATDGRRRKIFKFERTYPTANKLKRTVSSNSNLSVRRQYNDGEAFLFSGHRK